MMLSNVKKQENSFESLSDLKHFFQSNKNIAAKILELTKLIQIFYLILVTTYTNERRLSMLYRLKNFKIDYDLAKIKPYYYFKCIPKKS